MGGVGGNGAGDNDRPRVPRQRRPEQRSAAAQGQPQPTGKPRVWTRGLLWLVLAALAIGILANILS